MENNPEISKLLKELVDLTKAHNEVFKEMITEFLDGIREDIEEIKRAVVNDY